MPAKPMTISQFIEKFPEIPDNVNVEFGGTRLYKIEKRGDMPGYWAITSPRKSGGRYIDKIHLNEGVLLVVNENKES